MVHGLTVTNLPFATENCFSGPKMTELSSPGYPRNAYSIQHSVMVPLKKLMKIQSQCYDYDQFQKPREGTENDVILNVTSGEGSSDTSSTTSKSESDDMDVEILEEISPESQARDLNSVSPILMPSSCNLSQENGQSTSASRPSYPAPKENGNVVNKTKPRSSPGEYSLKKLYINVCK